MADGCPTLGLKCRVCGKLYPESPINFCTDDFGPLEVAYDYEAIRPLVSRQIFAARPRNMWRYRELLPVAERPGRRPPSRRHPAGAGRPPRRRARRRPRVGQERRGELPDALVQGPRGVGGPHEAKEFGYTTVGCASTGNLANSVAANAAQAGLEAVILIPADLEAAKVLNTSVYGARVLRVAGTYDEVNRLCTQVAFKYNWGFVNINLRPFYAEGSKTYGYEIADDLGLAPAAPRGRPDGRREPDRQDSQGVRRTREPRAGRGAAAHQNARRPGHRVQPNLRMREVEPRAAQAGAAPRHHLQESGHRRPGRRAVQRPAHPRDRGAVPTT